MRTAYLNIPKEDAIQRYMKEEDEPHPDDNHVDILEFEDSFFYYQEYIMNQEQTKQVTKIIDKMLTTKKFKDFFNKNVAAL